MAFPSLLLWQLSSAALIFAFYLLVAAPTCYTCSCYLPPTLVAASSLPSLLLLLPCLSASGSLCAPLIATIPTLPWKLFTHR